MLDFQSTGSRFTRHCVAIDKPFATCEGAMQLGHYCEFVIARTCSLRMETAAASRLRLSSPPKTRIRASAGSLELTYTPTIRRAAFSRQPIRTTWKAPVCDEKRRSISVFRWLLYVIDDEHFDRSPGRFESEAELILERSEYRGTACWVGSGGQATVRVV